ncbi:MAG: serine hydrolase [Cyanophyceae cyanobacterium]
MAGLAPHQRRTSRRRSRIQPVLRRSEELRDPVTDPILRDRLDQANPSQPRHLRTRTRALEKEPRFKNRQTRRASTSLRRSAPLLARRKRPLDPIRAGMIRTLGLSLALGLVVGTLGHLLNRPSSSQMAGTITLAGGQQEGLALSTLPTEDIAEEIFLNQPQLELGHDLKALLEVPGLIPHILTVDLDTGAFVNIRGSERVQAASVIKIPVLVAFLQAVDRGEVRLDELLTLDPDLAGGGSGDLQVRPYGSTVDALTAATMMITISDNYATNLIIARLGGREALNQTFQEWGLDNTQISWLLPDLEGTNTVSPADVVSLLQQVEAGELLSLRNRDRFFEIMRGVENRLLLPAGLGEGASIAHKTGNIRSVLADAGIIDMPNGHRYFVAVLLKRELPNDPRANDLIPQASRLIYDYWQRFGEARLAVETERDPEVSAEL